MNCGEELLVARDELAVIERAEMRVIAWLTSRRERQRRYMFDRLYQKSLQRWKPPSVERAAVRGVKASVSLAHSSKAAGAPHQAFRPPALLRENAITIFFALFRDVRGMLRRILDLCIDRPVHLANEQAGDDTRVRAQPTGVVEARPQSAPPYHAPR